VEICTRRARIGKKSGAEGLSEHQTIEATKPSSLGPTGERERDRGDEQTSIGEKAQPSVGREKQENDYSYGAHRFNGHDLQLTEATERGSTKGKMSPKKTQAVEGRVSTQSTDPRFLIDSEFDLRLQGGSAVQRTTGVGGGKHHR